MKRALSLLELAVGMILLVGLVLFLAPKIIASNNLVAYAQAEKDLGALMRDVKNFYAKYDYTPSARALSKKLESNYKQPFVGIFKVQERECLSLQVVQIETDNQKLQNSSLIIRASDYPSRACSQLLKSDATKYLLSGDYKCSSAFISSDNWEQPQNVQIASALGGALDRAAQMPECLNAKNAFSQKRSNARIFNRLDIEAGKNQISLSFGASDKLL